MVYHPGIIILLTATFLAFTSKQEKLFKAIAIISPIIAFIVTVFLEGSDLSYFLNIKLTSVYEPNYILIAYSLQFALLVINIFNCYISKLLAKKEIIWGTAYAGFTHIALFAGDFISLFTALELMMICSTVLIYLGGKEDSINAAGWYFLTHLFSSSLVLIGVAYIHSQTDTYQIFNLNEFINQSPSNAFFTYIMLLGALINIAVFPFCGWMVNYYADASPAGFGYLISFTTKLSLVIIIKLFAGLEALKYIAIATIIYSSLRVVTVDNLFKLLSLLSILQIGFMLYAISNKDYSLINAVFLYLFVHIVYKALLSVTLSYIGFVRIFQIVQIKNITVLISLLASLGVMINLPLTASSIIKLYITNNLSDNLLNYLAVYINIIVILALPIRQYWDSKEFLSTNFTKIQTTAVLYLSSITIVIGILGSYPLLSDSKADIFYLVKQSIIIGLSLLGSFLLNLPRYDNDSFNLIQWVGSRLSMVINHDSFNKENSNKEAWSFSSLEKQLMIKLTIFHNQQTAIFIIFTVFMVFFGCITFLTQI